MARQQNDEKVICLKRIFRLAASIVAIILLIGIDQVTKKLAQASLPGKGVIPIIDDFFVLVYATNRGGFLSFGSNAGSWLWWTFFVVLPLVVLVFLSVYVIRYKRDNGYYLSFWIFVISGGVGNLTDRILYGEVIDFMNIGFGPKFRTGVFNVADLYLNVFTLIVVLIFLIRSKKGEPAVCREEKAEQE